jgi:hypothetical protein
VTDANEQLERVRALLEAGEIDAAEELLGRFRDPGEPRAQLLLHDLRAEVARTRGAASDAVAAQYREGVRLADALPDGDAEIRANHRVALAAHLVAHEMNTGEAERLATEALALRSVSTCSDYLLLNIVALHSTTNHGFALPFAYRAVEVADAAGRGGLGVAARLAVAKCLWHTRHPLEAETWGAKARELAESTGGSAEMVLFSMEAIRAGKA